MIIELLYKYLDHDVRQLTTRYAEARTNDPELRDLSQLGDGTSDQQLIRRLIVTGVGKLRAVLRDKLVNSTENADDKFPVVTSWEFNFKEADADSRALAELMHWFIVRAAIVEWCRMFSPSDLSEVKSAVGDAADELDELLSSSSMPTKERRTLISEDGPAEVKFTYIP